MGALALGVRCAATRCNMDGMSTWHGLGLEFMHQQPIPSLAEAPEAILAIAFRLAGRRTIRALGRRPALAGCCNRPRTIFQGRRGLRGDFSHRSTPSFPHFLTIEALAGSPEVFVQLGEAGFKVGWRVLPFIHILIHSSLSNRFLSLLTPVKQSTCQNPGGMTGASTIIPALPIITWTLTTLEHIIYSTLVVFVNTDYARDTPQAGLGGRDDID